jgi:hypothetical protein
MRAKEFDGYRTLLKIFHCCLGIELKIAPALPIILIVSK